MAKTKWAMIKPGTVVHGMGWKNEGKTHTFTEADTKLRYSVYEEYHKGGYVWAVTYNEHTWRFENSKTAFTDVKIPAMKKEFVTLAVKDSEWEFERDWTFNGWVDDGTKEHTVPAGTRVKIIDQKMRLAWYKPQEKCIVAEMSKGLEIFAERTYTGGRMIRGAFIPAKEASQYLKLISAGKAKTYWKIEDNEGNAFVDKRFANLGNVKASLRVRYGLVKEAEDATDDEYIPEWVQYGEYEKPNRERGIWAVHYDHATNKELDREDMISYVFLAALKA
jgi:hypothetical protein